MDVSIFDGVSGTDHHAITEIDSAMAHTEKKSREHNCHHAKGSGRVAAGIPEQKEKRHSNQCRRSEADELPLCQVESHF